MRALTVIYYIFLACLAGIALLLIASMIPNVGSYKIMVVQSGSMEPAIKTGSVVMIKPVKDYNIGDIISFGEDTKFKTPTTHRIHDIEVIEGNPYYITKGDANNAPDQKEVSKDKVIGKVLVSIPYLGYAVNFVKKPLGFALIIIVPALIIIAGEIKKIYLEFQKPKEGK